MCAVLCCALVVQVLNAAAAVFMARLMVETKRQSLHHIRSLLLGE